MTSSENEDFKFSAINVAIKNKNNIRKPFHISNMSFSLNAREILAIYSKDEKDIQAFCSLFTNNHSNFEGAFELGNKLFTKKNNLLADETAIYDNKFLDLNDSNKRIIEIVENYLYKSNFKSILDVVKKNNKNDKHLRMLKIFKFKKIELAYIKAVSLLLERSEDVLVSLVDEISNENLSAQKYIEICNKFLFEYIKYLKKRINLLIDKNIIMVDLFSKDYNNRQILSKNHQLSSKAKELVKRLSAFEKYDKNLTKIKNNILKTFVSNKSEMFSEEQYNVESNTLLFNSLIENWKSEEKLLNELVEQKQITNVEEAKVKYVYKSFIRILKKEISNFLWLEKNKALNLYWDLDIHCKKILYSSNDFLLNIVTQSKKQQIKTYVNKYIIEEIVPLMNMYRNSSKKNKSKGLNTEKTKARKISNTKEYHKYMNLEIEAKDLFDEIEWTKKSLFYDLNNKIDDIVYVMGEETKKYYDRKVKYNVLVERFFEYKNKFTMNFNNEITSDESTKLSDDFFRNETQKFEKIYQFIARDNNLMEKLFTKSLELHHNTTKSKSFIPLIRYTILKQAKKIDMSIFDLLTRVGKTSSTLNISTILLVSLISEKSIYIFKNIFANVAKEDTKTILNLIKKISKANKESNKFFIFIEKDLKIVKDLVDKILIVDNSIQIESGDANIIKNFPVYHETARAMGNDAEINNEHSTPIKFNNGVFLRGQYDNYKFIDNHFIFGDLEDIYNWTNIVPIASKNTIFPYKINILSNKIISDKKQEEKKYEKSKNDETTDFVKLESKEFLIIDVK